MRNYIRIRAGLIHGFKAPATNAYLFGYGEDLDEVNAVLAPQKANAQALYPTMVFTTDYRNIWVLLDSDNLCYILNGRAWPSNTIAQEFWTGCDLPGVPFGQQGWCSAQITLDGSPRKTWSHGH